MLVALAVVVLIFFVYVFIIRPRQLRWGATHKEFTMKLPGDEFVVRPDFIGTRAVTVKAKSEKIWEWIIQIGSGRAGWYSIDWIDNGGNKSSETIIDEFQRIEEGQFIPFTPDGKNGLWVKEFIAYQYILWTDKKRKASWLWYLAPSRENETRLITRLRTSYDWKSIWLLYYLIYDIGDIIMMRKCLLGIKRRAERNT